MKPKKLLILIGLFVLLVAPVPLSADEGPAMLPIFGKHARCAECGWRFMEKATGYENPSWVWHPGWDFNLSDPDDAHQNIYSIADGVVVDAEYPSPYDWAALVIEHEINGQIFYSMYGHCEQVFVQEGEFVKKGKRVAKVGTVDAQNANGGPAYHLHWEIRMPAPDHPNPREANYWTGTLQDDDFVARAYRDPELFVAGLNIQDQANKNGFTNDELYGDIHWWHGTGFGETNDLYYSAGYAKQCLLQDYKVCNESDIIVDPRQATSASAAEIPSDPCQYHAIVYDALGGARKAYTVKSLFWSNWSASGGPQGPLGMPITNRYHYAGILRQDFQKGYMENGDPHVGYEGGFAPGVTGSGWDNQFSYLFALAYERNGGRTKVGYATSSVEEVGAYDYKIQYFTGGEYGNCCIMYDPNNAVGNELATNEAYLLRSGFYEYYMNPDHGRWDLGCPTRDEYRSRNPKDWENPQTYPLQNFFSRRDYQNQEPDQHYMIWGAGDQIYHSAYTVSYVSQSPSGQISLMPGQTYQFEVRYRNTGTNSWYNNAEGNLTAYVELKSCDASGTKMASFLNWPYDESLGWLNYESPCTMRESVVRPGEIGTFRFTGKVPLDAESGVHRVYFAPSHSLAGMMQNWAGMHFQVNVSGLVVEPLYRTLFVSQNPSGAVTMEPGATREFTVVFKNNGNTTWYNDPVAHPNDYVELKSCDASGTKMASFLNWPYDESLGWLNYESPCTMNENSVAPGQNATFTLTGKAPPSASPGTYEVYFRPHHSANGGTLMPGWGGMHFTVIIPQPTVYACQYVSQNPSGQFDMVKGTTRTFTVSYRNTGTSTWYNNPVTHPNDYVELKSCDASGTKMASFLNDPYDPSLGWLNYESPCTMNEASVAPGGIATFTFTGKVASTASIGLHLAYFGLHHSTNGGLMLPGWGGLHYQVNVLDPPVYACQFVSQSPAGQFNFGEGTSRVVEVKFRNTGNRTWRKDPVAYPNDYVELKSCDAGGNKTASFYNWPYQSSQGWLNYESPCTFLESSVPPGSIATFRFTARVNEGQSSGVYLVYFRPHHSANGGTLMPGWGGMHFQTVVPVSYSCEYVSQSPAGQFNMAAGTQRTFWVKFRNTGNTTWRKNPSSYPNDYVELKSCDGGQLKTASFLNWPYDAGLGWLNYESPCTFDESSVPPGGIATFTFRGKVNGGTSSGLRLVYFSPHHSTNGGLMLPGWGGMHYQVNVTASLARLTEEGLPTEFTLDQNYPNPFNPTTTIRYSLPTSEHVCLEVFNVLGQCIETLVNERQSAGEHSVLWNSAGFSSGMYFYRITAGDAVQTKKMILLK